MVIESEIYNENMYLTNSKFLMVQSNDICEIQYYYPFYEIQKVERIHLEKHFTEMCEAFFAKGEPCKFDDWLKDYCIHTQESSPFERLISDYKKIESLLIKEPFMRFQPEKCRFRNLDIFFIDSYTSLDIKCFLEFNCREYLRKYVDNINTDSQKEDKTEAKDVNRLFDDYFHQHLDWLITYAFYPITKSMLPANPLTEDIRKLPIRSYLCQKYRKAMNDTWKKRIWKLAHSDVDLEYVRSEKNLKKYKSPIEEVYRVLSYYDDFCKIYFDQLKNRKKPSNNSHFNHLAISFSKLEGMYDVIDSVEKWSYSKYARILLEKEGNKHIPTNTPIYIGYDYNAEALYAQLLQNEIKLKDTAIGMLLPGSIIKIFSKWEQLIFLELDLFIQNQKYLVSCKVCNDWLITKSRVGAYCKSHKGKGASYQYAYIKKQKEQPYLISLRRMYAAYYKRAKRKPEFQDSFAKWDKKSKQLLEKYENEKGDLSCFIQELNEMAQELGMSPIRDYKK